MSLPRVGLTVEQLWQPVPGGSGRYIEELGAGLVQAGADVVGIAARHRAGAALAPMPVVRFSRLPRVALYESWNRWRRPAVRDVDVLHATTWAVPGSAVPLVVTVHDLAFLRTPEHFTTRGVAFFRRALRIVASEASAVVVPSTATADDCISHGIEAQRIHVVPHGVRVPHIAGRSVEAFRATHGLDRDYVLWVGTLEPRKNVPALVEAFTLALRRQPDLDLVLVGPAGWGSAAREVSAALDAAPDGRVRLLGRLEEADLHAAYAGARVFAFPSLWEGFGMPVLEAMAHGIPVVTSAGTAMAEIAHGAALLVDPHSPDELAEALERAAGPDHDELTAAGRAVARAASWERATRQTLEVYRGVSRSG